MLGVIFVGLHYCGILKITLLEYVYTQHYFEKPLSDQIHLHFQTKGKIKTHTTKTCLPDVHVCQG